MPHMEVFSALKRARLICIQTGVREGDARGIFFPGPEAAGNREDDNMHAKFFCNQAQNY